MTKTKMIKKLLVLAVLGLFILSLLPGALAENDQAEKANRAEKANQQFADELENQAEKVEKARENVQERVQVVKGKVVQAQEKFKEAKEKYQEKRREFLDKKNKLQELKENAKCNEETDEENGDCRQKKNLLKEGVRQHLVKTIELIERSLEKLANRVEASGAMSDEEKEEARAKLSLLEQRLTEKKAEMEAMAGELSGEELKAKIRELKSLWQETRKEQRQIIAGLISHKQETLVGVYTKFGERLETQINSLAEQGADVSELGEKLAKYKDKVGEMEDVEAGKFAEFRAVSREAKSILREILAGIKEVKEAEKEAGETEDETDEEEAGEEDEEETEEAENETEETPEEETGDETEEETGNGTEETAGEEAEDGTGEETSDGTDGTEEGNGEEETEGGSS